jgi:hypothetical protein
MGPARADDLDDFNRAVEDGDEPSAASPRNICAPATSTSRRWNRRHARSVGQGEHAAAPAAFRDQPRYTSTILEIAAGLLGASLVLNLGRPDVAREQLGTIRAALSRLRRENDVAVLADCVLDANTAMDALFAHDKEPDWESVSAGAESYRATLRRCDGMAPVDIRGHPEFRRLIDGALASLTQVPAAVEGRDRDLLHRLLIELRSFDHLLAFRYG